MSIIKSFFSEDNYIKYLELCKASKMPFIIEQSNYTLKIQSEFINVQFMQNMMSKRAFIAYQKIKSDISKSGLVPPEIDRRELKYYKFEIPNRLKQSSKTIYNIDIKSAYATVLKNHLIISPKTFAYLSSLHKQDRLASVGMLAGRKNIFEYTNGGELKSYSKKENELANFFYFAVLQTQYIMQGIQSLLGRDFLFYWVDGVYFENENRKDEVFKYLSEKGYKYSFDILQDFSVMETGKLHRLFFKKEGEEKTFTIPKPDNEIARKVIDFLGVHKKD